MIYKSSCIESLGNISWYLLCSLVLSLRMSHRENYKRPRRLVPRGWSLDGCILEKLNKIPKGLSTEYKEAGKAWAQYVQDKTQYVQD